MNRILLSLSLLLVLGIAYAFSVNVEDLMYVAKLPSLPLPVADESVQDTLPPRFEDFINSQPTNPFDLQDPASVEQTVEYDPDTEQYIIRETIGTEFFRPPTYMTVDEYMAHRRKQDEQAYFNELAGVGRGNSSGSVDPLSKIDVKSSLIDRLFGGTKVDIRPQGNIDLTFGVRYQYLDNPVLTERQRRGGGPQFDFDMNIQMNVTGKIGEKLNLNTNYNTKATFNFDNQIKLDYNSDLAGEDDILKRIEAGNVSLPLRGSLIQGGQSLFGLKTELQFGHLRITALASQQQSQRRNIQLQGGTQLQEFEVRSDAYDENRHFFLSHANRDAFEEGLENLPQIKTLFHLENIEVWITNNRNEVENVRDIVAIADLGEPTRLVNPASVTAPSVPRYRDVRGRGLPDNDANDLYSRLLGEGDIRDIDRAVNTLQSPAYGMVQSRDFEKVRARKLNPREYTVHPELGFISVNINVQPNQVLAVSYQYKYNGNIYKVGELSVNTDNVSTDTANATPQVLFVKMLKSTTQRIDVPTWDLMMKNVYSIGAYQVNREDFKLDIFYEDPGRGEKRFLPQGNLKGIPLLNVFNLDNLNTQLDPQPDGVFDFVTGVTINPINGRIMFPVLEPFGSALANQINDASLRDTFTYPELYSLTQFQAQEFPEKNRYMIRGSYKSSVASEISLGAFNIPQGSVRVSGGGQIMVEGQDYEVDYSTGRVRILNDAILASGIPVNISFEDNTLFGFQTKVMLGLRADYELSKHANIGATILQLYERPFTPKVNIGDDPINNKIYGLDYTYSKEAPWLTRAVDALPFFSTKQASNISLTAEAAYLDPGHARAINETRDDKGGMVFIDDFEGSASSFDLRQPVNQWYLASVPQSDERNANPLFPESREIGLVTGANRALLNWYRIDPIGRSQVDNRAPYTSLVPQNEVFPNVQLTPEQIPNFQTLDLIYRPRERGPYNFDRPGGYPGLTRGISVETGSVILNDPKTRWGGIMRAIQTNDFQSANIEFLEFWMLSPFLDNEDATLPAPDAQRREGTLYINLGNISEDILKDSRQFAENAMPGPANEDRRVDDSPWGVVPIFPPNTRAFDNAPGTREIQDVGLDGLNNEKEREHYASYLQSIAAVNPATAAAISEDPSNDDFVYFNDERFTDQDGIRERYRKFNGTEGNSQSNEGNELRQSGTNLPDIEDLNNDNTLNESESYFQYEVPLKVNRFNQREIDMAATPFITDRLEDPATGRIWYRFRIPLNTPEKVSVGGILDFRSIQFMRMYMHGFEEEVVLRFATLELVRNQWRRYTQDISTSADIVGSPELCGLETTFDVDAVNIEENSSRMPFNYTLPIGIARERSLGVFATLQNEQSLSMKVNDLCDGAAQAIFKYTETDMRVYERLKMFVHAEEVRDQQVPDDKLRVFIRIGSDFQRNYYEYEIPLKMSDPDVVNGIDSRFDAYKQEVWRQENEFDFDLRLLTDLKEARNNANFSLGNEYVRVLDPDDPEGSHVIRVRGNPNLGFVKVFMIGVRNPMDGDGAAYSTEVWVNELRLTGLDERGGVAALARLDMQLADLGNLTLAGNFSSIGFGALDNKVHQRARESTRGYAVAANIELSKFLPQNWGLRLPFYGQISNTTETPEYDPYDRDIVLRDKLRSIDDRAVRDSIRESTREVTDIITYNFTNVRKERAAGGSKGQTTPKLWDIENFSLSYAFTQTTVSDPIIEFDQRKQYTGSLDYGFSRQVKYWEPFKNIKSPFLKLISEINLNPIPNTLNASSTMDRQFFITKYRFTGVDEVFSTFYNKRFLWNRDYNLQWDLTKSLKINFDARAASVIDEPDERRIRLDPEILDVKQHRRDSIWENISRLGRPKDYTHNINVSYNLPLRFLPFMDWVNVRAQYTAGYTWSAASVNADSLGNVIQNDQNRQISADLNFDKLYDMFPYLKKINRARPAPKRAARGQKKEEDVTDGKDKAAGEKKPKPKNSEPSTVERALIRPLMLLRKARFSYQERFRTVVPGFMPDAGLLGMQSGFGAPGWDFAAGFQPKIRTLDESQYYQPGDWLHDNRDWISPSLYLNQDVLQDYNQTYDARVTIEPFTDFRLELELNRSFTENHSQTFKDTSFARTGNYVHAVPANMGSMTVTYSALQTLFQDSRTEIVSLFRTFERNQIVLSQRLGGNTPHSDPFLAEQGFREGYGKNQQDILIPAFIAAYTEQDPNSINLNLFNILPKVNWRLQYNGLSKVPFFSEIFTNFTLTHGYKSTLTVNSFRTGLDFAKFRSINGGRDTTGNFYARIEIPEIVIQEGFLPLLAISATTKNGISLTLDYKKDRTLALSSINKLLSESQSEDFTINFGYLLRDVDIPFLTGSRKKKGKKKDDKKPETPKQQQGAPGRGGQLQGRDMDIQFAFSFRDDVTYAHKLDGSVAEPTRGTTSISISPSVEYKLNRQLSLRAFFDYRRTIPKTSIGFPRIDNYGGVVVRFQLN